MSKGRQTLDGAAVRRVQVMLDDATIERAKVLGDGNLSRGIRQAFASLPKDAPQGNRGMMAAQDNGPRQPTIPGRRAAETAQEVAMQMSQALRDALQQYGWNAERVEREGIWGTRVSGSPHHLTLRDADGKDCYYSGPFASVQAGDQVAIVRFG